MKQNLWQENLKRGVTARALRAHALRYPPLFFRSET